MAENLTAEERQKLETDLKATDRDLKKLGDYRTALAEKLGITGGVEEQHKEAVSDAELFVSLGSAGQAQLAREDPERFAKLAAAYREQGENRLFSRNSVL
jgi:hypothetical protein